MTVSDVSSSMQTWQASMQQRKQDFSQLSSALQSGDLTSAQKAFASLQSLNGQGQNSQTNSTGNSTNKSNNTISNDFNSLGQALQSGNLKDAQTALAKLQSDMKAQKSGHHHHKGTGSSSSSASVPSTANSTTIPENSTFSTTA